MTEQNNTNEGITFHEDGGYSVVGKEAVMAYAGLQMFHGLVFEYTNKSGMRMSSKGSPLAWLRRNGYTDKATKHGAIVQIIDQMREEGLAVSPRFEEAYKLAKTHNKRKREAEAAQQD